MLARLATTGSVSPSYLMGVLSWEGNMGRKMALLAGVAALLSGFVSEGKADETFEQQFAKLLAGGQIAEAHELAASQLRGEDTDRDVQFAEGVAQFLLAVEGLGQDLYRYGYTTDRMGVGEVLLGSPFFKLPIPHNPTPDSVSYEAARQILTDFNADLQLAERTLAEVSPGEVGLRIDLASVRLDLDDNGSGGTDEGITALVAAATGVTFLPSNPAIRFDESDVIWLRCYCLLISTES